MELSCDHCGVRLIGKQTRWCSRACSNNFHNGLKYRHRAPENANRITEQAIADVKQRFPSCARDWDAEMVEKAWPRLAKLLTRRLERLNG